MTTQTATRESGTARVAIAARPAPAERPSFEVRAMGPRDVMPAARLLAEEYRRARRDRPELPAERQSARAWFVELARRFERRRGVIAVECDEVVGFMLSGPAAGPALTHIATSTSVEARLVYDRMRMAYDGQR